MTRPCAAPGCTKLLPDRNRGGFCRQHHGQRLGQSTAQRLNTDAERITQAIHLLAPATIAKAVATRAATTAMKAEALQRGMDARARAVFRACRESGLSLERSEWIARASQV